MPKPERPKHRTNRPIRGNPAQQGTALVWRSQDVNLGARPSVPRACGPPWMIVFMADPVPDEPGPHDHEPVRAPGRADSRPSTGAQIHAGPPFERQGVPVSLRSPGTYWGYPVILADYATGRADRNLKRDERCATGSPGGSSDCCPRSRRVSRGAGGRGRGGRKRRRGRRCSPQHEGLGSARTTRSCAF